MTSGRELREQLEEWLRSVERLRHLEGSRLLLEHRCPRLDGIVRRAADDLAAPVAWASLLGDSRQYHLAAHGFDPHSTSLERSYCQLVGATGEPCAVTDTLEHPITRELEEHHHLRSYLGAPLCDPSGQVVGTLCVADTRPRVWTEDDAEHLRDLSTVAQAVVALQNGWPVRPPEE